MTAPDETPSLGKKFLLAGVATLVGLALSEWLCRLFIPAPQQVTILPGKPPEAAPAQVNLSRHPEQGGLYLETPAGRRLRPNTTVRIDRHALSGVPIEIQTNSLGQRNREPGPKKGTRILFLGDSITFADYLPEESGYVRQVETMARADGLDWETINAGVGAVSLKTELSILLESGLALQPDVVVLAWYLNDFQDSKGVVLRRLPPLARHSRLVYSLSLVAGSGSASGLPEIPVSQWEVEWKRTVRSQLIAGDNRREAFFDEVDRAFPDWGGAWSPRAWEVMDPLLREFARLSREHGFRPAWIAFPARPQVEAAFDTSEPQRRLAAMAAGLKIPLLDTLPVLHSRAAASTAPLFYDQCHHTEEASRIIARAVADWLRDDVLPK